MIGAKVGDILGDGEFPRRLSGRASCWRAAVFEVTVQGMRGQGEAKIDDDLGVNLGFEDLEGLKTAIREQINAQHATALRQALKNVLNDALAEGDALRHSAIFV